MRIAIVNDLLIAVEALRRVILEVPGYEIAWIARDGLEAVEKSAADPPDIILMDLIMPKMGGVEATRQIMKKSPRPILVVTSTVTGNAPLVFEAMGHGALDAINLPILGPDAEAQASRAAFLRKIRNVGLLNGAPTFTVKPRLPQPQIRRTLTPIIAIGSSTGGPKALGEVLSRLPATLGAAVVIVQHVDQQFSAGLAKWLDQQTPLTVRVATEGKAPEAGHIYVAGTNDHLILTQSYAFSYTPEPRTCAYRPSVDALFHSIASHWPDMGCAVLLTGMGRDGAQGLLALKQKGWHTIAQDEATSIVYGMPKAARELNAAVDILPVQNIGQAVSSFVTRQLAARR